MLRKLKKSTADNTRRVMTDFHATAQDACRPPRRVMIEDIQRAVARQYSVGRSDLLSFSNKARIARPRHIAMYLARNLTIRSLPEIARLFRRKNHTDVMYAERKIGWLIGERNKPPPRSKAADMPVDMQLAEEIEILKRQLQE